MKPVIAIHGGAGAIARDAMSSEKEREYLDALTRIVAAGQAVLAQGGSALDAVTTAVRLLEDCPLFNSGHGAVFTSAGTHELDASIMDGATLRTGAIANVNCVRNPVLAARKVMEESKHVFFVGAGAEVVIDNAAPECYSTYFRRPAGEPVRCGDFREEWAAQEYAAELSDQYSLPVVDHVLAAALGNEPVESTEHMSCPPGM